jgi:predicted nucleic acid-binding Zn ribbon protein
MRAAAWPSKRPRTRGELLTVPAYVYRRRDGSTFETEQRMADPLVARPTTVQSVERVLRPFTPRYRGTGFYSTDQPESKAKVGRLE